MCNSLILYFNKMNSKFNLIIYENTNSKNNKNSNNNNKIIIKFYSLLLTQQV